MTEKTLILLRGLPGSGKSTLAKTLAFENKFPVFSIDDFFTDENGNYQFDFRDNHLAYKSCEERTRNEMMKGTSLIIIDNTFTLEWEMTPYQLMAKEFGYVVHVMTIENRHDGKNIHSISEDQIDRMREKFKVIL